MSDTPEQTPSAQSATAPAASRRPLYAAVGAVALTALAGAGAVAWNARQAGSQAETASVTAPATAAPKAAPASLAAVAVSPASASSAGAAASAPAEVLTQIDQALAPAAAMAGPFGAWLQTSTWTGFFNTGAGVAARAAAPQTYAVAIQTYANPAIYIQQVLAMFGGAQASEPAAK